ncbi:MAG: SWIM zinc finger family protein [Candidatus Electrothrix sp. AR4]|nr:SWIM zinc finger family protein [Candidatus Electrothrix sp. AR4]
MKLIDATEASIKQFAGSTIFGRGYGYYEGDMVLSLDYDEDGNTIESEVAGNNMDYEVQVRGTEFDIDADCDCPYEGWPCKHVVAVLLTLIHQKKKYQAVNKQRKKTESSLASKIRKLSQNELAKLVIGYSRKYPDVKRELMVRLGTNKKATFETIKEQINQAFPSIESKSYSASQIARKITTIIQSVKDASPELQAKVYWTAADAAIGELDEYGMNDDSLEELAFDILELLVKVLTDNASLQDLHASVIDELMGYYISGNNGIVDLLYDTASELCSEESHYQIMIARLKKSRDSYDQNLLASWYAKVGDTDAQQRTLESKLEYGMDYWRLARYWFDQGDEKQGINIVLDGIAKGKGRKNELYEVLQKHYQQQKDYESILKLLAQKLEKDELDERNLKDDGTYQYLWKRYSRTKDYAQQKKLLDLCLTSNNVELDLYKKAEKALDEDDWSEFKEKTIANLQGRIAKKQASRNQNYGFLYTSSEISTLAEIFQYAKNTRGLFKTTKGNFQLMEQYESLLLPEYPAEYLKAYKQHINWLINARGR